VSRFSIHVCADAPADSDTPFQLRAPPRGDGSLVLMAWNAEPAPLDSGVPGIVAQVLARALAATYRITFATDLTPDRDASHWTPQGDAQVRLLRPSGVLHRVDALLQRGPPSVLLASTRDPSTVRTLFDVAGYPWELQAMPVLLSARDAAPPDIGYAAFVDVLGDAEGRDWPRQRVLLHDGGVQAVLRPGVDGDLGGLFTPPAHAIEPLLTALEHEARGAGVAWAVRTFDMFP
jgi:hypothetical protein